MCGRSSDSFSEHPKWKRLEELTAHIQRQLAPGAEVEHNVKVMGRLSGVKRQIDIAVRGKIGQFSLFIIIDCKDYKKPVDIVDVGNFASLIEDVGASRGALVAAHGYTDAAKTFANAKLIDLYQPVDSGDHEWRSYATIPVRFEYRFIHELSINVATSAGEEPCRAHYTHPTEAIICDAGGNTLGTVDDAIKRAWDSGRLPRTSGVHKNLEFAPNPIRILASGGQHCLVDITITVTVVSAIYFAFMSLEEFSGFYDESTGDVMLSHCVTEPINTQRIIDEATPPQPGQQPPAITPAFTVVTYIGYLGAAHGEVIWNQGYKEITLRRDP